MEKNEKAFIDYYFTYVVGGRSNADNINEAYFILKGERPSDNCGACIKQRKQRLDNTYVSLIKVQSPTKIDIPEPDKVFEELISAKKKSRARILNELPDLKED